MAHFEVLINKKLKKIYMDDKLFKQLNKRVKKIITIKDEDFVIVVDGRERSGKSVFAMQIAKQLDSTFNLSRLCFNADEFQDAIRKAEKGQAVILDEAYRSLGSRGALSEVNKLLVSLMMEMGQKNLVVIVVLPTFYLLDKYVALWRARGLFHVFKSKGIKGCWRFYNSKKKQMLYNDPKGKKDYSYLHVKTRFKGRFYNQYVIDEQEYREKKRKAFEQSSKNVRVDKFKEQRNKLLIGMYEDYNISLSELVDLCKKMDIELKKTQIYNIITKNTKQ